MSMIHISTVFSLCIVSSLSMSFDDLKKKPLPKLRKNQTHVCVRHDLVTVPTISTAVNSTSRCRPIGGTGCLTTRTTIGPRKYVCCKGYVQRGKECIDREKAKKPPKSRPEKTVEIVIGILAASSLLVFFIVFFTYKLHKKHQCSYTCKEDNKNPVKESANVSKESIDVEKRARYVNTDQIGNNRSDLLEGHKESPYTDISPDFSADNVYEELNYVPPDASLRNENILIKNNGHVAREDDEHTAIERLGCEGSDKIENTEYEVSPLEVRDIDAVKPSPENEKPDDHDEELYIEFH